MKSFVYLALALSLVGAARAHATDPRIEAEARARFERGQKLSADHLFTEAAAEFAAGYALSHKPLFLFNMAECAREAGDRQHALESYQRYLAEDPAGRLAPTAREHITELRASLAGSPVVAARPEAPVRVAAPEPRPTPPPQAVPELQAAPRPDLTTVTAEAPRRKPVWKRTGFWVGIGAGAVAVIVAGTVAGVLSAQSSSVCTSNCVDLRMHP